MRHLCLLLLVACAAGPAPVSVPVPVPAPQRHDPQTTLRQLRARIGAAACAESAECRTVALGAKACGGPEFYLPWSSRASSPEAVAALAARYQAQRQAEHAADGGVLGDCRVVADPGAVCRRDAGAAQGQCALRPAGPGGRADPR